MTGNVLEARRVQVDLPDEDIIRLRHAIDAVCAELGIFDKEAPRRARVEARMRDAFARGPRHNLNLVDAGLRA